MSVSPMQDLFQWSLFSTELFSKVAPSTSLGMSSGGSPLASQSALPALLFVWIDVLARSLKPRRIYYTSHYFISINETSWRLVLIVASQSYRR